MADCRQIPLSQSGGVQGASPFRPCHSGLGGAMGCLFTVNSGPSEMWPPLCFWPLQGMLDSTRLPLLMGNPAATLLMETLCSGGQIREVFAVWYTLCRTDQCVHVVGSIGSYSRR